MFKNIVQNQKSLVAEIIINADIFIFLGFLVVFNTHLLMGGFNHSLIFLPSNLISGEFWRLFTHPFVHLSWYHLFLDGSAFFLLYLGLEEKKLTKKISYVIACAGGSLIVALSASSLIYSQGLCGLSGIGHGLMAVSGLEMMRHKKNYWVGLLSLLLVVSKSIYETIVGRVLFSFMHLGLCGTPLAVCHAGGVLGGIMIFLVFEWKKSTSTERETRLRK